MTLHCQSPHPRTSLRGTPFAFVRNSALATLAALALGVAPTFGSEITPLARDVRDVRIQSRLRELLGSPASDATPLVLDLKTVALAAMLRSDSFKGLMTRAASLPAEELRQKSLTDASFFTRVQQDWNRNQPTSLFGTNRFDQTLVELGIEKRFQTGTRFSLGLQEFRNNSTFGTFGRVDSKVAGGRLNLTQSLWKDFFGESTQGLLKSGALRSAAGLKQLESEIEDWFLGFSRLYHQVWMTQRRVETLDASLARKNRLAALFARRKSLGISEEADQIQVESAVQQTVLQREEASRLLEKQWSLLVVSLKLDDEDRRTDPTRIPVGLEAELPAIAVLCATAPVSNRELQQLELQLEATQLQTQAALDQLHPDLVLDLGLSTNGSVLNSSDAFQTRWWDTLRGSFPAFTMGLLFRLPLDASREKADALESSVAAQQLEARLSEARARLQSEAETSCSLLSMLTRHHALYQSLEAQTEKRIRLEETRYRQARVSPFNVLQAGEELFATQQALLTTRTEWWNQYWSLKKAKGQLFDTLDTWVAEKTGKPLIQTARTWSQP